MPILTLDEIFASDAIGLLVSSAALSPRVTVDDRVRSSFEEVLAFVDRVGRTPSAASKDLKEGGLAHVLNGILADPVKVQGLEAIDRHHLLLPAKIVGQDGDAGLPTLDDIFATGGFGGSDDIHVLRHVKPKSTLEQPDEVAQRKPCRDFESFRPLFDKVQAELESGVRRSMPFAKDQEIEAGQFYILYGLVTFVAEVGELHEEAPGHWNGRLRLIFSNGTESNHLYRSFTRGLYKDPEGRRISDPVAGPLFGGLPQDGDTETGLIYVLRSLSEDPQIARHRGYLHKIGVTGQDIRNRIQNAHNEPSFLMAPVDVVATYTLYNINRVKLENLLHRFFADGRADIEILDRFGKKVRPREWFFVPMDIVQETVRRLEDQSITTVRYSPELGQIVPL